MNQYSSYKVGKIYFLFFNSYEPLGMYQDHLDGPLYQGGLVYNFSLRFQTKAQRKTL